MCRCSVSGRGGTAIGCRLRASRRVDPGGAARVAGTSPAARRTTRPETLPSRRRPSRARPLGTTSLMIERIAGVVLAEVLLPRLLLGGVEVAIDLVPKSLLQRTNEDVKPLFDARVLDRAVLPVMPEGDHLASFPGEGPGHIQAEVVATAIVQEGDPAPVPPVCTVELAALQQ